MDISRQIINVNEYDLQDSPDAYLEAIRALAHRSEREGHPGVLSYQFYVNRAQDTAGAAIVYEDADAWLAHHHIAYQWDEMSRLQATVVLKRLTLFGPLNEALEEWISNAGLSYTHYDTLAAGFIRTQIN